MKLSNIQKESEKIKIKKSINEYEDLKASSLLKLGIMTFDKIRKNQIVDSDFSEICEEIKNYDIEIYQRYMQLRSFENENKKITCECGYVALKNEKFCPQCGNNLVKEEMRSIICNNCHEKIDEDSIFCSCCGSKIEKIEYHEDVYDEVESLQFNLDENIIEEDMEKEYILDDDKDLEEITELEVSSDKIEEKEDKKENSFLENEGREFLKNYQENSME